jgi:hypothetical protein
MAKLSTVAFVGKSGLKYVFDVWLMDQEFNAVGGIYAITRRYQNNQGTYSHDVSYIGETEAFSTRFGSHHKMDCCEKRGANCICTLVEEDGDLRLTQEDDLVKSYKPPCND